MNDNTTSGVDHKSLQGKNTAVSTTKECPCGRKFQSKSKNSDDEFCPECAKMSADSISEIEDVDNDLSDVTVGSFSLTRTLACTDCC